MNTQNSATSAQLHHAIRPDGPVAHAFANELVKALPWMSPQAAKQSVTDTLLRRRSDMETLPTVPEIAHSALDEHGLPEGKLEALVSMFAQPDPQKNEADALIHIHANLEAQRQLHEALASHVFNRGGAFERALMQELQTGESALTPGDAWHIASHFVDTRRERALSVVQALKPNGPVEQKATSLAYELRRAKERAPPLETTLAKKQSRLGEDLSFGLQQTLFCWATDFIDPVVSKWFQDKYKDHDHASTHVHTVGGEVIGDSAALFAFLGVRQFVPGIVDGIKSTTRAMGGGILNTLGDRSLRVWRTDNNISKDSKEYQNALENWKDFQADNFAKSSIVTVSSVGLNVAAQKALGNTHTWGTIFQSKLIGAAITMAAMMGARYVAPKSTKQLDDELNERYFTPAINVTQRVLGLEKDDNQPDSTVHVKSHHQGTTPAHAETTIRKTG